MSESGMELLLVETENTFWPFLTGRALQGPGSGCLHGPPSPPPSGTPNNATHPDNPDDPSDSRPGKTPTAVEDDGLGTDHAHDNHHHHRSHAHPERGVRTAERKTVAGFTRRPHSYYECCINVHVSALLDHWLDWDRPLMSKPEVPKDSTYIAKLMSHLATLQDPVPRVRDFCSNLGCDSLNRPDNTGRTLLHHLLSGKLRTCLGEMCRVLLEFGADPEAVDRDGNTPLIQVRQLLEGGLYDQAAEVSRLLVVNYGSNVNAFNHQDRSLLSYSVTHFDKSIELTRFLINAGAAVSRANLSPNASTLDIIEKERISSAFVWFVRSLMARDGVNDLEGAHETLCILGATMSENPQAMKQHVQRTMMQLGKSRTVNGPLFRHVHAHMVTYWTRPHDLRLQAVKTVRKSMGPKRLANGLSVSRLGLPKKLQDYVDFKHFPESVSNIIKPASFSSQSTENFDYAIRKAINTYQVKSTE